MTRTLAPLCFAFVSFCLQKQQQQTNKQKNKTIIIFEFFILSAKNDKQLIHHLLFRPRITAESSASTPLWY